MNKLRKIGVWCWNVKERCVLLLMVLILALRVYVLVNAEDETEAKTYSIPASPSGVDTNSPPPPPPLEIPEPITRLSSRSPFLYVPPAGGGNQGISAEERQDAKVRVLRIAPGSGGSYVAQITTGGARKFVQEGGSFESYQLISIDPDTECCIIYSENSNKQIERCVE